MQFQKWSGDVGVSVHGWIGGIIEKRIQRVKLFRRQWIVFVIMTLRTSRRDSQPGLCDGSRPFHGISVQKFLVDCSPFAGRDVAAIEACGHKLITSGIGKKVASHLPDGELIKREILIEGLHDPVAEGPHLTLVIQMQTMRVGIPGHIQPVLGHFFTVTGRCQISVDHSFIGTGCGIAEVFVDFLNGGWQPGDRKRDTANQGFAIGFRLNMQSRLLQTDIEKSVHGMSCPGHFGERRIRNRLKCPVLLIACSLLNPE